MSKAEDVSALDEDDDDDDDDDDERALRGRRGGVTLYIRAWLVCELSPHMLHDVHGCITTTSA